MSLKEQLVTQFNYVIRDYFLKATVAQERCAQFSGVGFFIQHVNPNTPDIEFGFEATDPATNKTARGRVWAHYNGDEAMTVEFAYPEGIVPPASDDLRFDVETFSLEDANDLIRGWLDHSLGET